MADLTKEMLAELTDARRRQAEHDIAITKKNEGVAWSPGWHQHRQLVIIIDHLLSPPADTGEPSSGNLRAAVAGVVKVYDERDAARAETKRAWARVKELEQREEHACANLLGRRAR